MNPEDKSAVFDALKNALISGILLLVVLLLVGCVRYNERFTYIDPETGATNHTVHVSHSTFLVWGRAAELATETQTQEFIRTVNAKQIEIRTDAQAIEAIGGAAGRIIGEAVKKTLTPTP